MPRPTLRPARSPLVKRALDVIGAVCLLAATLPIVVIGGLTVLLADGPPVLFRQARAGRLMVPFTALKLRTMRVNSLDVAALGQVRSDHELVLRPCRWLRRFKLDELPQLLNVIRGDMSLVGPRPTVPEQADQYDSAEIRRLEMHPGLTGWAQVNGNTELTWSERIQLDLWYIDHWSLGLDLRIMLKTLFVLVRGEHRNDSALQEAAKHAKHLGWRGGLD